MFDFGLTHEYERFYGMEKVSYIPNFRKDIEAVDIVAMYVHEHLDKSDPDIDFEVYIVWKSKILDNWKYLISTSLFDGMYYELTFNGESAEWYLDAYKKFENRVIPTKNTVFMKNSGVKPMSFDEYCKKRETCPC